MESVNQSRSRGFNRAASSLLILLCGLLLNDPLEASLFDPKRGAQVDQDQPVANSSSTLNELRLDGILSLGDHRRVLIRGPEGKTYRFNWRGAVEQPMAFKGESADRLAGYKLSSADTRSVWLQLPSGIDCRPDPDNGIAACEEGRAKLAMVRRSVSPESLPAAAANASGNIQRGTGPGMALETQQQKNPLPVNNRPQSRSVELQIGRAQDTDWIRMQRENQRVINSAPAGYFGYVGSSAPQTSTQQTSTQQTSTQQTSTQPASSQESTNVASSTPEQLPPPGPPPAYMLDPAWIQMQEENQRLIDSAPPGYFGVK